MTHINLTLVEDTTQIDDKGAKSLFRFKCAYFYTSCHSIKSPSFKVNTEAPILGLNPLILYIPLPLTLSISLTITPQPKSS
ncbi:MAG: hypothetical protein E3J90_06155 [Promethearchaeota archaeon]|nr:MAG: hypothetical protein E3J90_06155 [Candidatus Lokiarchaeota archaeon]